MTKRQIALRAKEMPASPIRKLVPMAEAAKAQGVKIYHLNIGQPDIESPKGYLQAIKHFPEKVVAYENSLGNIRLRQGLVKYYQQQGIKIKTDKVVVTIGGSEAIMWAMMLTLNPGDNCLVMEPFYANYSGFAAMAGIKLKAVTTKAETGFHLPERGVIEKVIDKKTKAIMVCNPNNPTGTVYSKKELSLINQIAKKYKLWLIADETYREFVYDQTKHQSLLNLEKEPKHVILVDSLSKRYSLCGARLGCLVSYNQEIMGAASKFGQARLAAETVAQFAAVEALKTPQSWLKKIKEEYKQRRNTVLEGLEKMPGVVAKKPAGAFYVTAKLPVKKAEDLAKWLLTDFRDKGETVMVAPAEGFYLTKNLGKDEIRIAYVLKKSDLKRAMEILRKGLEKYQQVKG